MARRLGAVLVAARRNKCAQITIVGLAAGAIATISACTTGDVFALQPAVDVGSQTAAMPQPDAPQYSGMQRLVPSNPYMTQAAYPRMDEPMSPTEQMPASEIDCRNELKRMGVVYQDIQPIHEGQCGIDYPVKVTAIGSVAMKPAATLTCNMAATFAAWTKNELQPAARWRYFSGVKAIHQGSSYSCRNIAGEGVLSEHGKGNALDVMSIELNNGDDIDVRKPGLFAFRTRGFLNNVRADGCQYFTTVLGPGYNYDHRNHFHFDIKNRKSGYRACR
ncbi:extensin family protein [Mesorhizobium sp. VK25A]|uniref:Extensin family protein n=1 Tax=Mesorhizobium vachelliae TaxID=3072309 RepID=A0ABU5A0T9_9HYPH|nr:MULTISPECIES: extensin family protein [unclassified Mesorhizobium]MDX8530154.1 extensin family protein [Mesorhizobium sp. VK25D]MDX8542131.1 extensin family protein [Mesorhizobium sp. VK25A]